MGSIGGHRWQVNGVDDSQNHARNLVKIFRVSGAGISDELAS